MKCYGSRVRVVRLHLGAQGNTDMSHYMFVIYNKRRVSSVVEHSSANSKVPGSIPGPVSYRGHGL